MSHSTKPTTDEQDNQETVSRMSSLTLDKESQEVSEKSHDLQLPEEEAKIRHDGSQETRESLHDEINEESDQEENIRQSTLEHFQSTFLNLERELYARPEFSRSDRTILEEAAFKMRSFKSSADELINLYKALWKD